MPGSFRIARVAGIDIWVHFSWVLIFVLVMVSLASEVLPTDWSQPKQLVVAAIAALLFFVSVLTHELAHSLVARHFRLTVSSITLFLFGGVANLTKQPQTARAELFMASAGPLTSFGIAGGVYLVQRGAAAIFDAGIMGTLAPVTDYLTTVNVAVGLFNLVPGFPLDGGRVLRSIVWAIRGDRAVATSIAAAGGKIVAIGLALLGAIIFFAGDTFGLWYLLIAYFLFGMANAEVEGERMTAAAAGVRVSQVMVTEVHTATASASLDDVARDIMLRFDLAIVPVVSDGRFVGFVTADEVRAVGQEGWPLVTVAEVMTPASELPTLTPDDELMTALERLAASPVLPVVREGAFVGLVYREAAIAHLRTRHALGLDRRRAARSA